MTKSVIARKLEGKEFFGHPSGLFVLFFAEMWERMSYYGMRALLVLYMVKYLLMDPARMADVIGLDTLKSILEIGFGPLETQPFASQIYGLYTGFVYLSPFFGGILADKIWGKRKSVYVGGALMAVGHFLMAFENLFLPALFFLILGNGAFKPNISTQVGALYKEGDTRRDGAFTIFYMGINLGAFFSPFLCVQLAEYVMPMFGYTDPAAAWHFGFALAGIGMLIGLVAYHIGRELLPAEDLTTLAPVQERKSIFFKTVGGFLASMALFILLLMLPNAIKAVIIVAIIAAVVWAIKRITDPSDRAKVASLVILCTATIMFWAIFEQQGNTLALWADEKADWAALGLKAANYQSMNPMFIFLFAPLMDAIWRLRARKGKVSSSVRKMAVGSFLAGVAFLIIPIASEFVTVEQSMINLFWLTLTTWMFTMGELYLSPIGLSFVTKVAPARFMSMMMGMWFLSSFIGNYMAGYLGTFYTKLSQTNFFLMFAIMGFAVGVFFWLSEKRIEKAIGLADGGSTGGNSSNVEDEKSSYINSLNETPAYASTNTNNKSRLRPPTQPEL
jgi:POT family proton-dependent oligopeptide transporter